MSQQRVDFNLNFFKIPINYNLNAPSFGGHRKGRGGNPKGLFGRSPGFPLSL